MNNRSPEQEASELPKAKASLLKEQTPDHGMRMLFLYGCLLGLVAFVGIVGIRVLNVGYVDWLMQKADGMQHYLGWLAYRQTPWTFPIGLTNALSYPFFTSVVYTDPIPLFAVFFKVLSPLLPATFQYFGIWALLCFMLQGGLAAILIYRFVQKKPLCLLGAAFFVLSMPLLMRALYHHEALMAQWIILLAIALWLYRVKENDMVKRCLIWAGMGLLCAGVHMYFIPMTGILLLGSMATDFYTHRKALRCIFPIASYLAASVCFLFLMGAFYGGINACADGAGAYVSNLNSLFNPLGKSTLFKALPVVSENYEGSAYLGAGMLLLCATASLALLQKGWKNPFETHLKKAYLLGAIVMLLLCVPLALGPHITLNGRILFTIPYPGLVLSAFSMFRASGRFVWILFYLSLLAILAISLRKLSQRAAYILLSVCLCLQIIDGFAVFRTLHSDYSAAQAAVNPLLKSELMQSFLGNPNYRHIEFLDALYETDYLQFAQYARQGNMSVSDFYFARRCEKTDLYRQDELKRVCGGAVSRDTIYVANSVSGIVLNASSLHWYRQGEFAIGVVNEIPSQQGKLMPKNSMQVLPDKGRFLKNGEDMPTGRMLYPSGMSYGPYISLSRGQYHVIVEGSNMDQCDIKITTDAGNAEVSSYDRIKKPNSIEYDFDLKNDAAHCEFLVENMGENDAIVTTITLSCEPLV